MEEDPKQNHPKLIFKDVFVWEGWGGKLRLASGKCRLWIFDLNLGELSSMAHLRPIIIVATDVVDSPMSIRSCAGHIVTSVKDRFELKPQRLQYVEYYPAVTYGADDANYIPERFEMVDFSWIEGKAIKPVWKPLAPPLLDTLKNLMTDRR